MSSLLDNRKYCGCSATETGGTSESVARTDAELEALKAEYRQKIAAAEAAKAQYEASKAALDALAEGLEDAAQETTLKNTALALAQALATPSSITVGDKHFDFYCYDMLGGKLYTCWSGDEDVYTRTDDPVYAGTNVYYVSAQGEETLYGTITAVIRITLADIYDRIGNIDFSTLAKEQTLTTGLQTLLTKINSKATKDQLTNATSTILNAIGNIDFTPILDDYAEQLRVIIGEQSTGEVA